MRSRRFFSMGAALGALPTGRITKGDERSRTEISIWAESAVCVCLLLVHLSIHAFADVRSQGQSTKPFPGGIDADLWVVCGQSNSFGWGLLKAPVDSDPRIMQLNRENEWVLA